MARDKSISPNIQIIFYSSSSISYYLPLPLHSPQPPQSPRHRQPPPPLPAPPSPPLPMPPLLPLPFLPVTAATAMADLVALPLPRLLPSLPPLPFPPRYHCRYRCRYRCRYPCLFLVDCHLLPQLALFLPQLPAPAVANVV
jgi:hypothetical protein